MVKIHFDEINSTNTYLKENYLILMDFTLVSALHQTSGKGRLGRIWVDDKKSALFSILVKDDIDIQSVCLMPLICATSLHKVLNKYLKKILIKWPNDLLFDSKKIAGILVESVIIENEVKALILGFGVNINNSSFASELEGIATSLYLETKFEHFIANITEEIANQFENDYHQFKTDSLNFVDYCNKYSFLKNQHITFEKDGIKSDGIALDMLSDGSLSVKTNIGTLSLQSGEITLSLKQN